MKSSLPIRMARRCTRCGCTNSKGCAVGCAWLCGTVDICSTCVKPGEEKLLTRACSLEGAILSLELALAYLDDTIAELKEIK